MIATPKRLLLFMIFAAALLNCCPTTTAVQLPETIQLGQSLQTLLPLLERDCGMIETLNYTGEMAAPFQEQTQVNCTDLEVFGARRKVEFMFNDGPLGHIWIHVHPEEIAELQKDLAEAFGRVVHETETYRVFAIGTVALRMEPPEVLVATPGIMAELTGYQTDPQ